MSGRASRRLLPTLLVVGGVAVGLALRAWVLTSPMGGLDADEAVWGLMARHALDGELATFFWNQSYGGTQEMLGTALVFAVVGSGTLAVRAVPMALVALAALLVWRVGLRTVGEPAARLAAVLFWVWPAYLVWKSTRAHGYYGAALVLALAVVLLALRLRGRASRRDAAVLGLMLGLGWWATPQVTFVAVPVLVWLVWRRPGVLRDAWPALPVFVLGAAPWLLWNVRHGLDSLEPPFASGTDYWDRLEIFFATTLPAALGLRVPFSLEWVVGPLAGRFVELLAILAGVAWFVLRRCRAGSAEPLVVVALSYPLLQALSPLSSLNDEPRYLVLLLPFLALLVAALLARNGILAAAGLASALALSIGGLAELGGQEPPVAPVGSQRVPADLGPALDVLDQHRVDRVLAPYAVAYRVTFESRERIIATSTGQVRYRPHDRLVLASPAPAYVFVAGSEEDDRALRRLEDTDYRRIRAGDWSVYVPPSAP